MRACFTGYVKYIYIPLTLILYFFMGFPGGLDGKESTCNAGDLGSILGSGRSPGEGNGYPLQYSWASLVAQMVKNLPAMQETWVQSRSWEDPLEKGKATHSSNICFPGGSDGKASACNVGDLGSISGSGRSPGEGNGNPLQSKRYMHPNVHCRTVYNSQAMEAT